MSGAGGTALRRPKEVTIAGLQTVIGSGVTVFALLSVAQQLDSTTMRDTLTSLTTDPRFTSLNLTLASARSLVRYTLMVMGALSVTSIVLGVFVLRRHQSARVALTVLGCLVALICLFGGPPGWVLTGYVGVAVGLLWTRAARDWFAGSAAAS